MEAQPFVSIIINNYNYERFLSHAIDSALNQTYPHVEVIVVDDGSTDHSRELIESYGHKIIPVFQANGKQGAAFNSGFAASRGDIIIFLDADDYLFSYTVERITSVWKPNLAKVHYRLEIVDADRHPLGTFTPPSNKPLSQGEVWRLLFEEGVYTGTSTSGNALNRKALTQVTPIPDQYRTTADDYLSTLIPFYGEVIAIDEPLGAYRIHTSNQWALATVTGDRFHRFVQHDIQSYALITQKAAELNYSLPDDLEVRFHGHLWSRLASLRLNPQNHPISSDRPLPLIYWGIRALWKYSDEFNWQKRLFYSLWFLWVGLLPLPLAQLGITWLFVPHKRPKVLSWIRRTTTKPTPPASIPLRESLES